MSLQAQLCCRCPAPDTHVTGVRLIVTPQVVDWCRPILVQTGMSAVPHPACQQEAAMQL